MKILILDNYDSFTYNLYQTVGELLQARTKRFMLDVFRNDAITVRKIMEVGYDRIIISPGPGSPDNKAYFGVCANVLTTIGKKTPVLGVCLGMQGMAHYFGGRVKRALKPMHGKTSIIVHDGKGVFSGLPQGLEVMRYHSLVADRETLPKDLEITAEVVMPSFAKASEGRPSGEIMGLRHTKYPIEGIQFHPESFATEGGKMMLANFLFANSNTKARNPKQIQMLKYKNF